MQILFGEPLFYIYLIYGLSFLLMAYLVSRAAHGSESVPMIASFYMLALFGLVHGIAEITDWIRFIHKTVGRPEMSALTWLSQSCLVLSFVLLLQFGINLLTAQSSGRAVALRALPVMAFIAFIAIVGVRGMSKPLAIGLLGRYAFGFVSSVLASVALIVTANVVKVLGDSKLTTGLYVAAVSFAAYAFFGGLITTPIAGLPIQLFRSACAVTIAVSCFSMITLSSAVAAAEA